MRHVGHSLCPVCQMATAMLTIRLELVGDTLGQFRFLSSHWINVFIQIWSIRSITIYGQHSVVITVFKGLIFISLIRHLVITEIGRRIYWASHPILGDRDNRIATLFCMWLTALSRFVANAFTINRLVFHGARYDGIFPDELQSHP